MTGLVKAITNQIGYLEGDESKPYLRLHYFRVVSRRPRYLYIPLIVVEIARLEARVSDVFSRV